MSATVRREFQQLISQATLKVGDELLGLSLPYYTSSNATPIYLVMTPQGDEASIDNFMGTQNESTPKIFSVSYQKARVGSSLLWVPGTVFRFQAGHYIQFEGFQWVLKRVVESTGLSARWDLHTTRSHASRAM